MLSVCSSHNIDQVANALRCRGHVCRAEVDVALCRLASSPLGGVLLSRNNPDRWLVWERL